MDEWINQVWYKYTMEYYLAFKRKQTLSCATTWVNLEDIMLSEISQSHTKKILYDSTHMRYLK